jgi:hypothetical protein
MAFVAQLDQPYELARALEPWARGYLTKVTAVPGRSRGFAFVGTQHEVNLVSKTRYDQLRELHDGDPLKRPLLRWVHRLAEMRVNQLWLEEDERLLGQQLHPVKEPEEASLSLRSMTLRSLHPDANVAGAWQRNLRRSGRGLFEHRAGYFARCREFHERLGLQDVLGFWSPLEESSALVASFEAQRSVLADLLGECGATHLDALLHLVQGHQHEEGWPARLSPDALSSLFAAPEFFRGTSLLMGPLPPRAVPASFWRGGFQLGRALHCAWAPVDRPLTFVRDPDDAQGHSFGNLCMLWFLSRAFDKQVLGLSSAQVKARRRSAAAIVLGHTVLSLLRADVHERAMSGRFSDEDLEEVGRGLFQRPLERNSALVNFNVRRDEPVRLAAFLDAAAGYQQYVAEFDEDFLRNPRAREKLRAEAAVAASCQITRERVEAGRAWLMTQVQEALS